MKFLITRILAKLAIKSFENVFLISNKPHFFIDVYESLNLNMGRLFYYDADPVRVSKVRNKGVMAIETIPQFYEPKNSRFSGYDVGFVFLNNNETREEIWNYQTHFSLRTHTSHGYMVVIVTKEHWYNLEDFPYYDKFDNDTHIAVVI